MNMLTTFLLTLSLLGAGHLSPVGNLTVTPLDGGKAVQMKHFSGEIVIVDFWATWCPPCRVELPKLYELASRYKNKPVRLVAASLDKSTAKVQRFLKRKKLPSGSTYMVDNREVSKLGIRGLPTTLLLGPDGKIIKSFSGFAGSREIKVLQKEIDRLLTTIPKRVKKRSTEV